MSFHLQGPTTLTVLPNPQLDDTEGGRISIVVHRGGDGTIYSYGRRSQRRVLAYNFQLTRAKTLELEAFLRQNYANWLMVTNHLGEVWRVKVVNNPFEFEGVGRRERYSIT